MGRPEFIALMAAMVALDAFSIDGMLPALSQIDAALNIGQENHRQYIITTLFLGFSVGVLIYGFLADQFGRKWPAMVGFIIYIIGSVACITADTFPQLLFGRVLQGLGAAGPYVLSVAIVRDRYEGRDMAQILSLIMMIFIGVPIVAPFIGQGILLIAGWRSIFGILMVFALLTMAWFWIRQAETLRPENRIKVSLHSVWSATREVMTHRQSLTYLLAVGVASGAFIAYLSTGQQVFQEIYSMGEYFPIAFASLASTFGVASYMNSRWVQSIGSVRLVHRALGAIVVASVLFLLLYLWWGDAPPLWSYLVYMAVIMFSFGMLFGNMNALALEPMGHIAGAASSLVSSVSTIIAILLATIIGSQLGDNVYPIIVGFGLCSAFAWVLNYRVLQARLVVQSGIST